MKFFKNKNGFSLIEITIASSILLIILALGYNFIVTGFRTSTFSSEQETAIQNARKAMEIMTKEIRESNYSELGSYPLETIEENDFLYYSDVNDDGKMEKIRYVLDGLTLKKVTTLPGPLNDYNMPGATTTIANYVNNQEEAIFTYYDNSYNEACLINNVRLINIKLKINVTPERVPMNYTVETDVTLRNLKDNL